MSARISKMVRATGLAVALMVAAPMAQAAVVWTTPDPVVAGQSARIVFSTSSRGAQPEVEVRVEAEQIVLMQSKPCPDAGVCFATWIPAIAEATLPPLAAGTYTVTLAWEDDDLPPSELTTLDVQAGAVVQVLPADGFWSPVGQPGSGLFVERRANVLAVSMYSYAADSGRPTWLLGSGNYAGDTAPLLMGAYQDGDCLGCAGYRMPTGPNGMAALQLRFESARRAWLEVAGVQGTATTVPVTSLPYGVDYVPHVLTDSVDAEFGPLPLPDLGGRWLFSIEDADAPAVALEVTVGDWSLQGEVLHWTSNVQLNCRSADGDQRAGCTFNPNIAFSPPLGAPLDNFYSGGFFVPLGNIQEDRMRGVFEDGGRTWHVRGFRTGW